MDTIQPLVYKCKHADNTTNIMYTWTTTSGHSHHLLPNTTNIMYTWTTTRGHSHHLLPDIGTQGLGFGGRRFFTFKGVLKYFSLANGVVIFSYWS